MLVLCNNHTPTHNALVRETILPILTKLDNFYSTFKLTVKWIIFKKKRILSFIYNYKENDNHCFWALVKVLSKFASKNGVIIVKKKAKICISKIKFLLMKLLGHWLARLL